MIKFCRTCGKELATADDKTCHSCGANAVKGTTYCRYCSHSTTVDDTTCSNCGAALKPLPSSARSLFEYPRLSVKMGKIINLSIVVVVITLYVVFTLPKSITRPIKAVASDAVFQATGYTALPLDSISIVPTTVPRIIPMDPMFFDVNSTWPLTVYAVYKNTITVNATDNATKATRLENITDNCTFTSDDPSVATVDASGVIHAISVGVTRVWAHYTAAPGSANMSDAAQGKIPITVSDWIPVTVNAGYHPQNGRPR